MSEEEGSNISKKKNTLGTDLLFSSVDGMSELYIPVSVLSLSAIPEALSSYNLGISAATAETLGFSNLSSFAMAATALSSYNSSLSALAAEVAKSYNSSLFAISAETLGSYNLGISSLAAEALRSSMFSSVAAMSEAFKDAPTLQSSVIYESLENSTINSLSAMAKAFGGATALDSVAEMTKAFGGATALGSVAEMTKAFGGATALGSVAEMTKALGQKKILSSITFESIKPAITLSSVIYGKVNALRIPSVKKIEVLSLPAEDPRQIFPNLISNIDRVENLEELDSEFQNDYKISDFEINSKAYNFLCNLETYLRHLITKRIIEPYKKNIESKIPQDVLSRCEERKSQDNLNEYNLIDYSDFTDLKRIFEKGRNKDLFKDIFKDEEYKALITKLHELDPIRKKIAHFRPLTKNEFNRLVLYHNDIFTIAKSRQP